MDRQSEDRRFLARWLLSTFVGWFLGVVIVVVVAMIGEGLSIEGQFPVGIGMGLGVGFAQWRVARSWFGATGNWVWTSAVGMTVPFLLLDFINAPWNTSDRVLLLLAASLGGFLVGALQRRALATHSNHANWWIAVSLVSWALAAGSVMLPSMSHPSNALWALFNLAIITSGGLVLGFPTGVALIWMLGRMPRNTSGTSTVAPGAA